MLDLKTFLKEALDEKQKKKVDSWKKGDNSFSDHVFGKEHTIYEPFVHEQDVEPHFAVLRHLEQHGYKIDHYVKGYAIDKYKRKVSIGKILNKTNASPDIKRAFESDPRRKGSQKTNLLIAYTRHPHHVAGMSTNQGWTSCLDMNDGVNNHLVHHDIKQGTHVAYLIRQDDKDIQHPIARIAMKKYEGKVPKLGVTHNILRPEPRQYGHGSGAFEEEVRNWTEKHFPLHHGIMKYEMKSGPYTDGAGVVVKNTTEAVDHAVKKKDRKMLSVLLKHPKNAEHLVSNHRSFLDEKNNNFIAAEVVRNHPHLANHFVDHKSDLVTSEVINSNSKLAEKVMQHHDSPEKIGRYTAGAIVQERPELADHFIKSPHPSVAHVIINRRPDLTHHFYDHKEPAIQLLIASKKEHTDYYMKGEFHERNPLVRRELAMHKHLSHFFYNDPDPMVRRAITSHKEHAKHLINDPDSRVRNAIIYNHPEMATHFKNDPDVVVRSHAQRILKFS